MIPFCNAHGIGIIPWGPLQAGDLSAPIGSRSARRDATTRKYSPADTEIISRVEKVAKDKGWTMTQVALAWVNKRVSSPIVGMSSVSTAQVPALTFPNTCNQTERLESAIVTGKELTEEEEKYLEEPYVMKFTPTVCFKAHHCLPKVCTEGH